MYSVSNAVTAALIGGALIVMVIMTLTDGLFPSGGDHGDHEVKLAYTIDVPEDGAVAAAVEEVQGPSLAELLVTASADKGARQFAKCKSCHTIDKGGRNGTGPNLYGILGRNVAATDGFRYSGALTNQGGVWDLALLDAWLASPKAAIPGNTMSFAGIRKPEQRADLIAYLNSFSDAPQTFEAVVEGVVQ